MRILPRSFATRLSLFFVVAVAGAQLLAFMLFMQETSRLDRTAIRLRLGEQVETLVRLTASLPPDVVAKAIAIYDTPKHHYATGQQSMIPAGAVDPDTAHLADHMLQTMGDAASEVRLALGDRDSSRKAAIATTGEPDALLLSVHLRDGRWLNATFLVTHREPTWMRIGLYQIGASIVAILAVVGLSRAGIVQPITQLAEMAQRVGEGKSVPRLPERGPEELRILTAAFNVMQERLHAFVADRTQMLLAIGHDLRTPIASLWLRAEMIEQDDAREGMIATIRQMGAMVDQTLAFAKTEAGDRTWQMVDLIALAQSVIAEHRTLGHEVVLVEVMPIQIAGDAAMLRRAIDNLVSNAIRYGRNATVDIAMRGVRAVIRVDDEGPGIPPAMFEEVLKPFVRLDGSRADDSGGTGLGLAVVRAVVRAHNGDLSFENRSPSGLSVEIALPIVP